MHTEAIFENIAERIKSELYQADSSIYIAVAWFTNQKLFEILKEKANSGVEVFLMITNDEINSNSKINYDNLGNEKSKFYSIKNDESILMHNKFCVIDHRNVITGSYNWSYKAEINHENIVINYGDLTLATQFINEFIAIRNKYFPEEKAKKRIDDFPIDKIIKRLEILKNFIFLEDVEDCFQTIQKLAAYRFNKSIDKIMLDIENKNFSNAIEKIQNFINQYQQLAVWTDPEIAALHLEINILENQINAFENKKNEIEKILSDFQYFHTKELGEIILKILKLQKLKYKDDRQKAKEVEEDFKNYKKQYDNEIEKNILELNDEEKSLLKKQYKSASILCHPDKFMNETVEVQKVAEEFFKELNEANNQNDLKKVSELLENLKNGFLTSLNIQKTSDKQKLKITVEKLKQKLQFLENAISTIKISETFQTIEQITNWEIYFLETKTLLIQELINLQNGGQ